MKLLDIKYNTNRKYYRQADIYGPLRAAAAVSQAISDVTGAAQDIYALYDKRKTAAELEQANLDMQLDMSEFTREHEEKEFYQAEELPDEIEVRRYDTVVDEFGVKQEVPRNKIPSHEVYPQLYRKRAENLIAAIAPRIGNLRARTSWTKEKLAVADEGFTKAALASIDKQREQIKIRQRQNINEALDAGKYQMARELNKNFSGSPEEQQAFRDKINVRQETDTYRKFMAQDNIPAMTDAIEFLKSDNYVKDGGVLTMEDRLNFINAMERDIASLQTKSKKDKEVADKLLADEVRKTVTALERGQKIDPDRVAMLFTRLDPAEFPVLRRDLGLAVIYQKDYAVFSMMNPAQRERLLKSYRTQMGDAFEAEHYYRMEQAHKDLIAEQETDTMGLGRRSGIIDPKEFIPLDYDNLAESLAARIPLGEKLQRTYGSFSGFLTKSEATELAGRINGLDVNGKISAISEITRGLGDRAPAIFQQLHDSGLVGTFPVAGIAASEGDADGSRVLLEGAALRKADPNILKNSKADMIDYLSENLKKAYASNPALRGMMVNAALDAYAYLSVPGENWDEDIAEQAMKIATGGLVEYNGVMLDPPKRYFGQHQFEDYVDGLHHSSLKAMGNPLNFTTNQLKSAIEDGTAQLMSVGHNEYAINYQGDIVRDADTGDLFIFRYQPDLMTKKQYQDQQNAAALARRKKVVKSQAEIYKDTPGMRFVDTLKKGGVSAVLDWMHGRTGGEMQFTEEEIKHLTE